MRLPPLAAIDETTMDETVSVELSGMSRMGSATTTTTAMDRIAVNDSMNTRMTHHTFGTYDSNALLYEKRRHKVHLFAFDALWECPWKCWCSLSILYIITFAHSLCSHSFSVFTLTLFLFRCTLSDPLCVRTLYHRRLYGQYRFRRFPGGLAIDRGH